MENGNLRNGERGAWQQSKVWGGGAWVLQARFFFGAAVAHCSQRLLATPLVAVAGGASIACRKLYSRPSDSASLAQTGVAIRYMCELRANLLASHPRATAAVCINYVNQAKGNKSIGSRSQKIKIKIKSANGRNNSITTSYLCITGVTLWM